MKKLLVLLLSIAVVFTLVGCETEPKVREMTYQEMKELEDQIEADLRKELQEDFDRDLQSAIDKLEPEVITHTVYEETKIITQEVPREPTDDEWKAIREDVIEEVRKEVTAENEAWLQAEREKLTPIEVEVEKEIEVPIEGDEYSHKFEVCYIFQLEGDNLLMTNGTTNPGILDGIFTNSTKIILEEPLANGASEFSYKNSKVYGFCVYTFGTLPDGFNSDYPDFVLPTEIPQKPEEDTSS